LPDSPPTGRPPGDVLWGVKQGELARELAREARLPAAVAQERIDELVHRIVKKLRRGQRVDLPGVGKLVMRPGRPEKR
jgi:nucleoid DNA-binding protein